MENHKHHTEKSDCHNDNHHNSDKHLDSLFPHIENSDINLQVGCVKIIVFKNCSSIYIEGKSTKIYFDIPLTENADSHKHSIVELSNDKEADTDAHNHSHVEYNLNEPKHEHSKHHDDKTDSGSKENIDYAHDNHEYDHEDEIDLSCEGVQILLCDCCSILKIKAAETDLKFSLNNFKKANQILTEENGYYVRRYKVELSKHITNASDQKLFINGKEIDFEYSPALQGFTSHLFFREYKNVLDLMVDYLKANPDLGEFKHHH